MSKHNKIKLEMSLVFQKPATKLQSSSVLISKLGFFSYSSSPTRLSKSETGWIPMVICESENKGIIFEMCSHWYMRSFYSNASIQRQ